MNASLQCPPVPEPTAMSANLIDCWVDAWQTALVGWTDCVAVAVRRGPAVTLDAKRWLELTLSRERPSWHSPHELVFDAPLASLRNFSTSRQGEGPLPVLVLPPQAGHDSCIVDYAPGQSQMRVILDAGLTRAMSLDWKGATSETKDATIDDYLDVVDRAVEYAGGRVNLIGNCQGGWLATIYAALAPERVNTLTLAGAPIDFHAGEPVIHDVLSRLAPCGDLSFYHALVAAGGGVLKGEHMLAGFVMIQPSAEISRHIELFRNVNDPVHVARYREFEDWFKHTQDIPGAFYLWIVRHLFRDNSLIGGELIVRDERVDLSRLSMPLHLLAGRRDHITPPDQVYALQDHASTRPALVRRELTNGGHLGLFMGHEALREQWPILLDGILAHST